jgi:hypothetical protein
MTQCLTVFCETKLKEDVQGVQIWPGETVTCLHTNSSGHIWTTLYLWQSCVTFLVVEYRRRRRRDIPIGNCRAAQLFTKLCANSEPQDQCCTKEQGVSHLIFLLHCSAAMLVMLFLYILFLWRTCYLNTDSGSLFFEFVLCNLIVFLSRSKIRYTVKDFAPSEP